MAPLPPLSADELRVAPGMAREGLAGLKAGLKRYGAEVCVVRHVGRVWGSRVRGPEGTCNVSHEKNQILSAAACIVAFVVSVMQVTCDLILVLFLWLSPLEGEEDSLSDIWNAVNFESEA